MTVATDDQGEQSAELSYLNSKFKTAARRGNIKLLEEVRDKGAVVNHSDASTALISAVQSEDIECVKYLVNSCEADVNLVNSKGETALHYACHLGKEDMVQLLLDNNADVHAVSGSNTSVLTCSMFSNYPEIALKLLDRTDKKEKSKSVELTFSLVKKHDKPKLLTALLKLGDVGSVQDEKGNNLAHLVVQFQREKCTDLLLSVSPELFDKPNSEGQLPLHLAALLGNGKFVDKIIAGRKSEIELQLFSLDVLGRSAVHYAAASAKPRGLKVLAEVGAALEQEDSNGLSPLTLACATGSIDNVKLLLGVSDSHLSKHAAKSLASAVHNQNEKAVKSLLRNGVIVETGLKGFIASPDESPFLLAGHYGNAAIIEMMIGKYEALLDQQDNNGQTVLHICASRGNYDALKYLCAVLHEEYLNVFTKLGRNAMWYAACGGHVQCVELLLQHNVNANKADNFDVTPLAAACKQGHISVLKLLVESGSVDINTKNAEGMTPLMQAAIAGQTKLVKVLIAFGADVNLPNSSRMTPLHHAAVQGKSNMCSLLVKLGADLNACDKKGQTPLHSAVYYGRSVVAISLVRMGASIAALDKQKNSCPSAAISCGHLDLARQLEVEYNAL